MAETYRPRLADLPKRYVTEPSLVGGAAGLTVRSVLADGGLLGRLIDTFAVAQLRPELAFARRGHRLHHLRTQGGRQEIDLVLERDPGRVVGLEVKATSAPGGNDARHLRWLREELGDRFVLGVVLHTGPYAFRLEDRILAVPICALWG